MTNEEILESSRLIAEFMGWSNSPYPNLPNKMYKNEEGVDIRQMKYHLSWDWIIPVVEKIKSENVNIGERSDYETAGTSITIDFDENEVKMWNETGFSHTVLADKAIDSLWQSVVDFIKWYNQQTK